MVGCVGDVLNSSITTTMTTRHAKGDQAITKAALEKDFPNDMLEVSSVQGTNQNPAELEGGRGFDISSTVLERVGCMSCRPVKARWEEKEELCVRAGVKVKAKAFGRSREQEK